MRRIGWQAGLGVGLVALSVLVHCVHYALFHDFHHILIYLIGDIAIVPAEVLLVTLMIHRLLDSQAKKTTLKKLNMVVGAFYSEVGSGLLRNMVEFCDDLGSLSDSLQFSPRWSSRDFARARLRTRECRPRVIPHKGGLAALRERLLGMRSILAGLLRNPVLLEHESFTDLPWAVFHLTEELE